MRFRVFRRVWAGDRHGVGQRMPEQHARILVGFDGEREVHVAHVLACELEVGIDLKGTGQKPQAFFQVPEPGLDHREVVVGLGDFRVGGDEAPQFLRAFFLAA